ncbi:MAG: hypothetical protein AAF564_03985 [Bacteroidota bacterium]
MGQQQLLLLVMGIIIVGFSVMAGVQIVEKNFRQHNADMLIDRGLMIAQSALAWKAQADPFEGGNASYSGLENAGFKKLFLGEETENGIFKISMAQGDSLELVAVSKRFPEVGIRVNVSDQEIYRTTVRYDGSITLD